MEELLKSTNVKTLDLSFNWIGNQEVKTLCRGLRTNDSLEELNLFGCQRISDIGLEMLLECVEHYNTSLRSIHLQAYDYRSTRIRERINVWLSRNRSGRYLLKHENMPGGLWPLVYHKCNRQPEALYYFLRQGAYGA